MFGRDNCLTSIIEAIMQYNLVTVHDGTSFSKPIKQMNGVLQGDPISPMMFNLATMDVTDYVGRVTQTNMYMYTDDMVMTARK